MTAQEPEPGEIMPVATLGAGGENIESLPTDRGVDPTKAVSADSLTQSLAQVGENDDIQYRLTQQAILADFGLEALRGRPLGDLEQLATQMSADGMRAQLAKLVKYLPDEDTLLVCAGVGWHPGIVGSARVGADLSSPAGYALRTGKPVLSNHLANEDHFRTPALLVEHGVKRAVNVLVVANDAPWGVLEVDSPGEGRFDVADIAFLQGFANLLGVAIERNRAEEQLRAAIDYQRLLVRESSHRAKNSLALVSSLLRLQAHGSGSNEVKATLNEAIARIMTIAQAHDLLWQSDAAGTIDLGALVDKLCDQLREQLPRITMRVKCDSLPIDAERAIAAGLLVTELITNAAKHAYAGGAGEVGVSCTRAGQDFTIRVADQGAGWPTDFDIERAGRTSFGMRMITGLSRQIGGAMQFSTAGGAVFTISAACAARSSPAGNRGPRASAPLAA